jgi:hypothetical protein
VLDIGAMIAEKGTLGWNNLILMTWMVESNNQHENLRQQIPIVGHTQPLSSRR